MNFSTRPLPAGSGVEVVGLNAGEPIDAETQRALQSIFIDKGVIMFRGVADSVEAHLNVSRCFGECVPHPIKELWVDGHPELVELLHRPADEDGRPVSAIYEVDGDARAAWQPWHADLYFMPEINRGGILRAVEIPAEGGKTGFLDRIRLYETLPARLKSRIEGLSAVYKLEAGMGGRKYGMPAGLKLLESAKSVEVLQARVDRGDFPAVVHPLVCTQAETGRRILNLSPRYLVGIDGMANAEGDALLAELVDHCVHSTDAYYHDWQLNDMVLWDNWRILHYAEGVPPQCSRRMQRTVIKGDYGLGRHLHTAAQASAHGKSGPANQWMD